MHKKILLILSLILFPLCGLSQEDSTVYLKPSFKKGDIIHTRCTISEHRKFQDSAVFYNDTYQIKSELLKTAYGLGIWKSDYQFIKSESSGINIGLKDSFSVLSTIDSNARFVAIENPRTLFKSLYKKSENEIFKDPDSIFIENFFPEIELPYFLNGAKYVKSEKYRSETVIYTDFVAIPCLLEVAMTQFNRKKNSFEIKVDIKPQNESGGNFFYQMVYTYTLHDLKVREILTHQTYELKDFTYSRKIGMVFSY